jgi:hypothetical protein
VSVVTWDSVIPTTFPLQGLFYPRAFPPLALPNFIGSTPYLTSSLSFELPRFYACRLILPSRKNSEDLPRSLNHFRYMPCSTTPRTSPASAHSDAVNIAFWNMDAISCPVYEFNGAQSLQPCGLWPTTYLSTLNLLRYRNTFKI